MPTVPNSEVEISNIGYGSSPRTRKFAKRHEAVIEQGRFTKRSLPWGIRPVSVNGGIGTNFPRHYFKTKISLAGGREAEFSVS